jgi:hypothetical protein
MSNEGLVKIAVPIAKEDHLEAETVWAEPLDDGLYRIRNLLWFAEDLHADDIVRCEERPGELPRAIEIVERSGHDTLRLIFTGAASDELRAEVLARLHSTLGNYERASEDGWSFDVNPGTDLTGALEYLGDLQQRGLLV